MPEINVAALDSRQQKLVENARVALERGNLDYTLEATAQVLKAAPGCLPVRRLQRVAQLRRAKGRGGLIARMSRGLSNAPFALGAVPKEPAKLLETAEALLARDPANTAGLRFLAEAAQGLGLPETVAFAYEAIRELEPDNHANLLALGEAWFAAGRPVEALEVADEILRRRPADSEAQNLMRKASIAQTVSRGGWDSSAGFRDKLRDERQTASLEQAGRLKVGDAVAQRLLDENLARAAQEPQNLNTCRNLVQAYRQRGELAEALAWVRKARAHPMGAGDETLEKQESELATALAAARVNAAEAAAAAAPDDAALRVRVEQARRELAEFRLAEAKRYVERHPNDFAARHTLGSLLLESGQIDAAIAQLQQAQRGPQVRIAALVDLGRCFKARRLHDLAVAQFHAAKNELGPMDDRKKDVIYELATCYELMGRTDAAMAEFKAVYSEDIGFRDVAEKINAFYARP
jgi:tetratricopeptide (TPR) repeat protein